jgi:mycothiol synthase
VARRGRRRRNCRLRAGRPHTQVVCYVRVDPERVGQGIATRLLELEAERAPDLAADEGRIVLHATSWPNDQAAAPLLESVGFEPIRYFSLMTIDLDRAPEAPDWPLDVQTRALDEDSELRPVFEAQAEVFRDHWGEGQPDFSEWLHEYAGGGFDPTLWFIAEDEKGIAGFALCLPELAEDPEAGYVGELGVRADRRGEGLGLALLRHAFVEFHRRSKRRVSLHVDVENLTGAVGLYTRAGMRPDPRLIVWERELAS